MMLSLTVCPKLRACVLNTLCFECVYGNTVQCAVHTFKTVQVSSVAVASHQKAISNYRNNPKE